MPIKKSVRIIKKIRDEDGQWRFVSLPHAGARYVWDKRPGRYFVEWWEGKQRKRESAGITHRRRNRTGPTPAEPQTKKMPRIQNTASGLLGAITL